MTQSAVTTKRLGSGREQRTDGLWKHMGQIDTSSLRASGTGGHPALTGAGVETIYQPAGGTIQCFDRDAQAYRSLTINAQTINLVPVGGSLVLPSGCVGTAQLAANAVSAPVGSFLNTTTFGTTAINAWQETSITTGTITLSGALIRVEWSVVFANNTAGAANQIGVGWNGTMLWPVAMFHQPTANYVQSCGGTFYTTPSAGAYRLSVFVNTNLGVLAFNGSFYQTLYVTEQKR